MSISTSISMPGHAQRGGLAYVTEKHVDHLGNVYLFEYGPIDESIDVNQVMSARANALATALADSEAAELIGNGA